LNKKNNVAVPSEASIKRKPENLAVKDETWMCINCEKVWHRFMKTCHSCGQRFTLFEFNTYKALKRIRHKTKKKEGITHFYVMNVL